MNLWKKFVNFMFPEEPPEVEDPKTTFYFSLSNNRNWEFVCDKINQSLITEIKLPVLGYDAESEQDEPALNSRVLRLTMCNDGNELRNLMKLIVSQETFAAEFRWGATLSRPANDCLKFPKLQVSSVEIDKISTSDSHQPVKMRVILKLLN